MRKRTQEILMMANYYEIIPLKKVTEVTLIEQLDLANMLEMFILADMHDAMELRQASKNLIIDNPLVCEILEGVGEVRHQKKKAKLSHEHVDCLYDSNSDSYDDY